MTPTNPFSKTLLSAGLAALLALSINFAFAQQEQKSKSRTYTDPVSGELRVVPKLLSEMTEKEKSMLTKEEKKTLMEIAEQVKKQQLDVLE